MVSRTSRVTCANLLISNREPQLVNRLHFLKVTDTICRYEIYKSLIHFIVDAICLQLRFLWLEPDGQ